MQKSKLLINCTALLMLVHFYGCQTENNDTGQLIIDEWQELTPDSFESWTANGAVTVSWNDDVLYLQTDGGIDSRILSPHQYRDFIWELEIMAPDIKTALLFDVDPEDNISGNRLLIDFNPDSEYPTGTILNMARATVPDSLNGESWHKLGLEVQGDHIQVFLDEEKVAETHRSEAEPGNIGIEIPASGEKLAIRNSRIIKNSPKDIGQLLEYRYQTDTAREWVPLLAGNDLTGWSPHGDGHWELEDGVLHGYSGENGGFLASEKSYHNFYLHTKFKIIKEDNSGIFIRKHPDSTNLNLVDAIECNIYDHNGPAHAYSTGSIATHARAWYGIIDYEDWNTMEIFAKDEHIMIKVNGAKSAEAHLPSHFDKPGQIALQGGVRIFSDQGPSDIYFTEMRIKEFD